MSMLKWVDNVLPHLLSLFVLAIAPLSITTYLVLFAFNSLWALAVSPDPWIEPTRPLSPQLRQGIHEYLLSLALVYLLGAPLTRNHAESLYLALHLAFRIHPSRYLLNTTTPPMYQQVSLFCVWCAPLLFLLDWEQWWQTYPYPVIVACEISCIFRNLMEWRMLQQKDTK